MVNPFDITFGKPPVKLIDRPDIENEVTNSFLNENRPYPLFILTGPRGCGKTVSMTSISNRFKEMDNWIVIDLNPQVDLEEQFAASLYQKGNLKHLFLKKEFNFSFKGFGISISGDMPVVSTSLFIEKMLEHLKKKDVNVLLTIDEVNNNKYMHIFAHAFQSYLRNEFKVSLIMTGLYDNVSSLENEEGLTFLYRAPKLYLPPLNVRAMTYTYMSVLDMEEKDAKEAAEITKGYAFAYQLLGYILFNDNKKKVDKDVLDKLDVLLDERSYSKIYSELPLKERQIVNLIAFENTTNAEIKEKLQMKDGTLSSYKMILARKGIIDTKERGVVSFKLPRFAEFIRFNEL